MPTPGGISKMILADQAKISVLLSVNLRESCFRGLKEARQMRSRLELAGNARNTVSIVMTAVVHYDILNKMKSRDLRSPVRWSSVFNEIMDLRASLTRCGKEKNDARRAPIQTLLKCRLVLLKGEYLSEIIKLQKLIDECAVSLVDGSHVEGKRYSRDDRRIALSNRTAKRRD